jgi:uncharacterized protein (TIGR00730 family)
MPSISAPIPRLRLCVYCGSRSGAQPVYTEAAATLGRAIGERGWQLVYGGGQVGLMGAVADAALAAGASAIGVIPESLMRREVGHAGLTELHVVPNMHLRKQAMAERADAFIALPGGLGTLEELFEVWTWQHLGYHSKPMGLLNTAGYYDTLLSFLAHAEAEGFTYPEQRGALLVDDQIVRLLDAIEQACSRRLTGGDYSRI